MELLAKAILLAQKYHEESWNGEKYIINQEEAANKAANDVGFEVLCLFYLLKNGWNDLQEWAKLFESDI
jgi:hypothetical protein